MMRKLFILAFAMCGACRINAQEKHDTLQEVRKAEAAITTGEKVYHAKVLTVDSAVLAAYNNQNIAVLLAQQLPVFIHNYGTNSLATLSLRGASAAQTAVLWNGVPLQNGATGLVDLSTMPSLVADDILIDHLFSINAGSGAVGGTLRLNNDVPDFKQRRQISIRAGEGSFGRFFAGLSVLYAQPKWSLKVDAFSERAQNDFQFLNTAGLAERLPNAMLKSYTIKGTAGARLSSKDVLTIHFWGDRYFREIPPALFESVSKKQTEDGALRTILRWHHTEKNSSTGITASFINEQFRYSDSAIALYSNIHTRQYFAEPYLNWRLHNGIRLAISAPLQRNEFAGNDKNITKAGLVAGAAVTKWKYSIQAAGRIEMINGSPFSLGNFNGSFRPIKSLVLRAGIASTYRYPTLNELYYTPGGNPDLKPERGWSTEAGYDWKPKFRNTAFTFTHSGTAFYRDIHDWIIWFGGAVWTPHNIAEVVSKGLETENKFTYRRPKIIYQLGANATLISSKTVQSLLPNDGSIGHQIPYAPRIIAQGNAGFNTAAWRFNYNQTYTSDRYFNTDETGLLKAFTTGNVMAGYLLKRKACSADLSLTLQNVWNARYAEVSGRPAPGHNMLISCNISYFK